MSDERKNSDALRVFLIGVSIGAAIAALIIYLASGRELPALPKATA